MTLLTAEGLGKRFGGVVALDGVDLTAASGRVLGLLGANGSGKSTLSRILAGELRPDAGRILLEGREIAPRTPHEAALHGVVIAHQHPSLAPDLPVWENVFLGSELCHAGGFLNRGASRKQARSVRES